MSQPSRAVGAPVLSAVELHVVMSARTNLPRRNRHGFTLFECMLAVALLVGVVGALAQMITAGQMETYDSLREVKAMSLAEALMEEILAQSYTDPGGTIKSGV